MMELTTYTELEIAHRLMTAYAQKCRSLHGHRYEVEITVTAEQFNADGMIVDFKKLKEVVKTVLDDKWDHGSCFRKDDPMAEVVLASGSERVHIIDANPTLEWMVQDWATELQKALDAECPGVVVSMLKASETARNTVTWRIHRLLWDIPEKPSCMKRDETVPGDPVGCGDEVADNPDASLYLVSFFGWHNGEPRPFSATIRTASRGKNLIQEAKAAAFKSGSVFLNITKIPE